jgi:PAS domain S-box-containing protein
MNTKSDIKPSLNILLVEDNPGDVVIFKEHLADSGLNFVLTHLPTLKDALKKCADNEFDVILLDLGLPESSGLETLRKFPLASVKAPVIVMTGLDDDETALTALMEGAQDYLVKNNLTAESINRSVRYSIERKKIQEYQKKITLQFSTLASAAALINESEEISSIYTICCDNIKFLLDEQKVFAIEYLDDQNPYTSYYEWLKSFVNRESEIKGIDFYQANLKMIESIQNLMVKNSDKKVFEIKGGVNELLAGEFIPEVGAKIEELLDIKKIYLLGFSREDRQYGGIFILSKKTIEHEDIDILEVIANQASLSVHRRTIEKELILSEQRYRTLNKKLEERVLERTKDLAKTNALLEEELAARIRLEQELTESRDELEVRVQERTAELAASEARFHNMFQDHEAIMWLVKPETGVIVEANRSAKQFYGYPFSSSKQVKIQDLNIQGKDEILKALGGAVNRKNNYFLVPHQLASGETRTVEIYTSPIEINNEILLFSIIHDVTERHKMELALKESESLYKALVNNSMNIILISIDNKVEFANDAASEFSSVPLNKITGKHIDELLPAPASESGDRTPVSQLIHEAALDNRAVEIKVQNAREASFYFLVRGSKIQYKGKDAEMNILTDITENKNVEQFVLKKVIETEENDRRRFASDLHDDLGPLLSAVKLRLGLMENLINSPEVIENVTISNELMGLVVEKVRTISQNIAPHVIENLGLDSAIRDLCKRILLHNGINLEYKSDIEKIRFSQPVELHFYRIISELINNTLKHSHASLIHISLRCVNDTLKLIYYDNGKGYNVQEMFQKQSGIGLHNILNRVNLINGTIDFQQDKGKTVVKISKKLDPVATV